MEFFSFTESLMTSTPAASPQAGVSDPARHQAGEGGGVGGGLSAPPRPSSDPSPSRTPLGNTGCNLTVGVDWLNGVLPSDRYGDALALLSGFFKGGELLGIGRYSYRETYRFDLGAMLLSSPGRPECCVSINGDSLAGLTLGQFFKLALGLAGLGFRCSRLDVNADDYSRELNLAVIDQAREAGNFTGAKCSSVIRSDNERGRTGETIYFGRKGKDGSGRFIRFYDKELESRGAIKAIRYEVEFGKQVARQAFEQICDCKDEGEVTVLLASLLAGAIDFRERREQAHQHVDRMPRLSWWQAFVDRLAVGVRLKVKRTATSFRRVVAWLNRAVMPCVSKFREAVGSCGLPIDFLSLLEAWLDVAAFRGSPKGVPIPGDDGIAYLLSCLR